MVNKEHYAWLNKGVQGWNVWRLENPGIIPDLSSANLSKACTARILAAMWRQTSASVMILPPFSPMSLNPTFTL
jgi:hypothetical protein